MAHGGVCGNGSISAQKLSGENIMSMAYGEIMANVKSYQLMALYRWRKLSAYQSGVSQQCGGGQHRK
jgi:hypothetical protein